MMRYVIIDFMPLVHKYVNGAEPLEFTVDFNGVKRTIDTTIPNYTLKHILRCSNDGAYCTAVCLDGGSAYRKQYFAQGAEGIESQEYKGGRKPLISTTKEGADLTIQAMVESKISCYKRIGFEADDWIYTLICMLKEKGITDPIDVITNDRDMLPLVDDQVSVYIQSKRQYNEAGSPCLKNYFQVTPKSMELYCTYASAYKEYGLTYNTVLLYKMLKGDTSDNIKAAVKGFGKKTFNTFMQTLISDGVDVANTFRYGKDFDAEIRPVMEKYFKPEEVDRMRFIYNGLNLRKVPPMDVTKGFIMPKPIRKDVLACNVSKFGIHISC